MNRQTLIVAAVALLVVAAAVGGILWSTRRNRIEVRAEVQKVRLMQLDPQNTIAVLDFRVANPSTQRFIVRDVEVEVELADGRTLPAQVASEMDAARLFQNYPVLGQKFNPTLIIRDQLRSGESLDRMLAVRVETSEAELEKRKGFRIRVRDVDGPVSEIVEKRS